MSITIHTKSTIPKRFSPHHTSICPNRTPNRTEISQRSKESYFERYLSPEKCRHCRQIVNLCRKLLKKPGIHSIVAMLAAGFEYTGLGDTARCNICGLEVSEWSFDMKPFTIHEQRSPKCAFVQSMLPEAGISTPGMMTFPTTTSASTDDHEQPSKRQKMDSAETIHETNILIEINILKLIRKRTFSHWPQRVSPSSAQMIEAGFFSCNVGDRVICLYCNIVCQQWSSNTDDPYEIHKLISPKCPYIIALEKRQQATSILIINEYPSNDQTSTSTTNDPFRSQALVYTAACHPNFSEIPRRQATFETWPPENSPSVEDLVRAGFFYTGAKTIVTCFYCNGSLQNWGANDNPAIEHARWFPNCAYAKQLCGAELYRKIQESKRAQQERNGSNTSNQLSAKTNNNSSRGQLNIPDESSLSRYVAARLDLPISQRLLDQSYKLSIVKRCWEDQLRLKHDDFEDDCDIVVSAMVLQKQIQHIDGKKENIIIPNVEKTKIFEREQAAIRAREQAASATITDIEMSTRSESTSSSSETDTSVLTDSHPKAQTQKPSSMDTTPPNQTDGSSLSNPCVLCLTEEKRLACIPCGHLATCVPCGHSLRSCPICRREINAFVRIYI